MSFDEEWAGLVANAREQQSTAMQLNHVIDDVGGGGSGGGTVASLKVNQKDLAAIGDEAYKLYQDLSADAEHAHSSSTKAATSLGKDFALSAALDHVVSRWTDQKTSLMSACAHISNHLDYTKKAHQGDEEVLVAEFSKISTLMDGFDEGTQR